MTQTILAIETLSIAIIALILYACIFETKNKTKQNFVFIILLLSSIVSIGSDALSWALKGKNEFHILYSAAIISSFFSAYISAVILSWYLGLHASEKYKVSFLPYKILIILGLCVSVVVLAGCFFGWFYEIKDCIYHPKKSYILYNLIQMLYLLSLMIITLCNSKRIGLHDTFVICLYLIFPSVLGFIRIGNLGYELNYAGLGLGVLFIYITVQADTENGLIKQNQISYQQARIDGLTQLNNRLSFYEFSGNLSDEKFVGVIFCDVNGLKFTNDNFSHKEGDKLLCYFANSLSESFLQKEIFRISGDEFVVCMHEEDEEKFKTRCIEFKKLIDSKEPPVASIGYACGNGAEFNNILRQAEVNMYKDKEQFYKKFPQYKRS